MNLLQRLFGRDRRIEKKMRAYQPLVPPFDKPPILFSAAEAKQYFDWYMEHLDERCEYLIEKAANGLGCSKSVFDYSFDSLIPLWRWFLGDVETEVRSRERAALIRSCYAQSVPRMDFFADMMNDHRDEPLLSVYSEMVLRDVGMYWGQTFYKNCSDVLRWGYKRTPKNYIHVNEPLLMGFVNIYDRNGQRLAKPYKLDFEPIHYARVQAMNVLDKTATERDIYNISMVHMPRVEMARILLKEQQEMNG